MLLKSKEGMVRGRRESEGKPVEGRERTRSEEAERTSEFRWAPWSDPRLKWSPEDDSEAGKWK